MLPEMAFQFSGSQKKHFLHIIVTKAIDKYNKNELVTPLPT